MALHLRHPRAGRALLPALAAGLASLGCGTPEAAVPAITCGSSAPVSTCTVLVNTRAVHGDDLLMSNACQVSVSSQAGGGTSIVISTSGEASAPYPQVNATLILSGAPEAGQTYLASQLSSASLTAFTDPGSAWTAVTGPEGKAGDVALAVDSTGDAGAIHGSLSAFLVGQTAGGALSLCAAF